MNLKTKGILVYTLLGLFLIINSSCDELIDLGILIEGDKVEVDFEIPPNYNIGYQTFSESTSEMDLDSILESNNTTIEDITSIYINNITVSILNVDTSINFNQFDYIEATLSTELEPEIIIGYLDTIPVNSRYLVCKNTSTDILEYLNDSIFYLKAKGINNDSILDSLWFKGVIETEVNRRIL